MNGPFGFSAEDMALFHHYMISPELTLVGDGGEMWMRTTLPSLGFSFHYVLRLLLVFSSLHLARGQNGQPEYLGLAAQWMTYRTVAEHHYQIAIREVASALPYLDKNSCYAIYAATVFIFCCALAKGPYPGEYLGFSSHGKGECLTLFMGIRSVLDVCHGVLLVDVTAEQMQGKSDLRQGSLYQSNISEVSEYRAQLEKVRNQIKKEFAVQSRYTAYCMVLDRLISTFDVISEPQKRLTKSATWSHIFGWLYRLPDHFIVDLQQKRPLALILFAFFSVLLKELDFCWIICGWPEHILSGVHQFLDDSYLQYIRWPIKLIGLETTLSHL